MLTIYNAARLSDDAGARIYKREVITDLVDLWSCLMSQMEKQSACVTTVHLLKSMT